MQARLSIFLTIFYRLKTMQNALHSSVRLLSYRALIRGDLPANTTRVFRLFQPSRCDAHAVFLTDGKSQTAPYQYSSLSLLHIMVRAVSIA